jgi:hypothetical protein
MKRSLLIAMLSARAAATTACGAWARHRAGRTRSVNSTDNWGRKAMNT